MRTPLADCFVCPIPIDGKYSFPSREIIGTRQSARKKERSTKLYSKGKEKTRSERDRGKEVVKKEKKGEGEERWKERKEQKVVEGEHHQLEHCGRLRIRASRATVRDCVWVPACTWSRRLWSRRCRGRKEPKSNGGKCRTRLALAAGEYCVRCTRARASPALGVGVWVWSSEWTSLD